MAQQQLETGLLPASPDDTKVVPYHSQWSLVWRHFRTDKMAIALVAVLKPSIWIVILVIAFSFWAPMARIIHGQVLAMKQRDFIEAARALGVGNPPILYRHILPHIIPVIIVYTTLGIATSVL